MLEFICGFLLALVVVHFKEQQYTNYIHGVAAGTLGGAVLTHILGGGMKKRRGDDEDVEEGFLRGNLADLFRTK